MHAYWTSSKKYNISAHSTNSQRQILNQTLLLIFIQYLLDLVWISLRIKNDIIFFSDFKNPLIFFLHQCWPVERAVYWPADRGWRSYWRATWLRWSLQRKAWSQQWGRSLAPSWRPGGRGTLDCQEAPHVQRTWRKECQVWKEILILLSFILNSCHFCQELKHDSIP